MGTTVSIQASRHSWRVSKLPRYLENPMRSASVSCSVYPQPSKQSSSSAPSQSWSSHKAQPNLAAVGADVVSSQSPTGQPMERRKSNSSATGQFAKILRVSVLKHALGVSQLRGGGLVVDGAAVELDTADDALSVGALVTGEVLGAAAEELTSVVGPAPDSTSPRVAEAKRRSALRFILFAESKTPKQFFFKTQCFTKFAYHLRERLDLSDAAAVKVVWLAGRSPWYAAHRPPSRTMAAWTCNSRVCVGLPLGLCPYLLLQRHHQHC